MPGQCRDLPAHAVLCPTGQRNLAQEFQPQCRACPGGAQELCQRAEGQPTPPNTPPFPKVTTASHFQRKPCFSVCFLAPVSPMLHFLQSSRTLKIVAKLGFFCFLEIVVNWKCGRKQKDLFSKMYLVLSVQSYRAGQLHTFPSPWVSKSRFRIKKTPAIQL